MRKLAIRNQSSVGLIGKQSSMISAVSTKYVEALFYAETGGLIQCTASNPTPHLPRAAPVQRLRSLQRYRRSAPRTASQGLEHEASDNHYCAPRLNGAVQTPVAARLAAARGSRRSGHEASTGRKRSDGADHSRVTQRSSGLAAPIDVVHHDYAVLHRHGPTLRLTATGRTQC